jgi:hypothetical protein
VASTDWAQKKATIDTKTKAAEIRANMTVEGNKIRWDVAKLISDYVRELTYSCLASESPHVCVLKYPGL